MATEAQELLKRYKCPVKKHKEFALYWRKLLPSVANRDNFAAYHLKNLEILCNLYIEYDKLTEIIKEEGFSYYSHGRHGEQRKTLPEVTERTRILGEIRQYSRLLGILLNKDNHHAENGDDSDWS